MRLDDRRCSPVYYVRLASRHWAVREYDPDRAMWLDTGTTYTSRCAAREAVRMRRQALTMPGARYAPTCPRGW